jgi:Putative adhesin
MMATSGRITAIAIGIPLVLGTAAWGAFSVVGLSAHASERHVASYAWHGGAISVDTGSGSVEIEAGTGSEVTVAYTEHYELKKPTVAAATSNGGIQLTARCPTGIFDDNCAINYVVTVPASAPLVLHSGDGALTFDGVSGAIVATTGDGDISGTRVLSDAVQASTGDGGIDVEWARGPTNVVVSTGDGDINLVVPAGSGPYRASTHTGDGGVDITVPTGTGASASITATTGDGGISIGFPGS